MYGSRATVEGDVQTASNRWKAGDSGGASRCRKCELNRGRVV
jgi:hypothetical protein